MLAAMVTLAACGSDGASSGPQKLDLKIGDLVPRTGFPTQFGEGPHSKATDLAADEIRKCGGEGGAQHKVTVTHVDYRSAPTDAASSPDQLVDAGRAASSVLVRVPRAWWRPTRC